MRSLWRNRPLWEEFDRLFEEPFAMSQRQEEWPGTWGLALDVAEKENDFVVTASLPGVNPDDIDITLTENSLTIKGEMRKDETIEEENYHMRERRYGSFQRTLTLPTPVDAENIQADFENGVLTVHLPKTEAVRPKRISVKANGQEQKVIEGQKK
jgi:HSP20 family protein